MFAPAGEGFYSVTGKGGPGAVGCGRGYSGDAGPCGCRITERGAPVERGFAGGWKYKLVSKPAGLCLQIPAAAETSVALEQRACDGSGGQAFVLTEMP